MKRTRNESTIERSVCAKAFTKFGVRNRKMNGFGARAWPDRLFLIPGGRPLFIEFKREGLRATPLQQSNHEMLRALGYKVEVCDSEDQALGFISYLAAKGAKGAKGRD